MSEFALSFTHLCGNFLASSNSGCLPYLKITFTEATSKTQFLQKKKTQ